MEQTENPVAEPSLKSPLSDASPKGPELKSIGFYRQALIKNLSPEIFLPNPWRLMWYGACLIGSLGGFIAITTFHIAWPYKLMCGLLIGICNGTLAFICHEIAHGSVIKSQIWQDILGYMGALPFCISPTFWKQWHNRLHHGKTQQLIKDPDAFPNMRIYRASRFMRFIFPLTPGSGHRRSFFYFFYWFSFHNFVAQFYLRFRNDAFDIDNRRVNLEFGSQVILVMALLAYAGPSNWLWVLVIPIVVQNYILMSYISTNHNLSPLTPSNDPLANSLSVTNHPVLEYLNLNFGYHVEHHIFPTVSGSHAKIIHKELVKQFPKTYQVMPKWKAMKALYRTPRIYKNSSELINPETRATFPTL